MVEIMISTLENKLKQAGLSEGEARVYLASLESGPDTVMHLAEKAKIKRPTCYVMIESLIQKGLMSSFIKGKKRYFSAEHPGKLLDLIAAEREEILGREGHVEKVLPELASFFNVSATRPRVRFFEGKEGVRAIQRDILKSKPKEIHSFIPLDVAHELFPPQAGDVREKILKIKGLKTKTLYTSNEARPLPEKGNIMVSRRIDPERFPFSTEVVIYNDKIAFLSFKEEIIGVIVESKQITDTMRTVFDLAWHGAAS